MFKLKVKDVKIKHALSDEYIDFKERFVGEKSLIIDALDPKTIKLAIRKLLKSEVHFSFIRIKIDDALNTITYSQYENLNGEYNPSGSYLAEYVFTLEEVSYSKHTEDELEKEEYIPYNLDYFFVG